MTAAKTSATILGGMKAQRNPPSHTQPQIIVEQIQALDGEERLRRIFELLLQVAGRVGSPAGRGDGEGDRGDSNNESG